MKNLVVLIVFIPFLAWCQKSETIELRIAPAATFDLSVSNSTLGLGTCIGFVIVNKYKPQTTFLLEAGYSLKALVYGNSTNGSNTKLNGLQITTAWEWGEKWKFGLGGYMNLLITNSSQITIANVTTDYVEKVSPIRNVDLGSTVRLSHQIGAARAEFGVDNTLVNLIENNKTKLYPVTFWIGLRFKL